MLFSFSSLNMFKSNCDEGGAAVHKAQHQWFGVLLSSGTSTFATTHCGSSHRSDGEIHCGLTGKPYGDWKDTWKWQCCKLPSPRCIYDSSCNVSKLGFSIKWDYLTLVKPSQKFLLQSLAGWFLRVDTSSCLVPETIVYPCIPFKWECAKYQPITPILQGWSDISKSKDLGSPYVMLEFPMALLSILAAVWQLFAWSPSQPEVFEGSGGRVLKEAL